MPSRAASQPLQPENVVSNADLYARPYSSIVGFESMITTEIRRVNLMSLLSRSISLLERKGKNNSMNGHAIRHGRATATSCDAKPCGAPTLYTPRI